MEQIFRCSCPITSGIDIIGDKWTLVIIKQMLLQGKKTFKDFTNSDEAIATNILSSRIKRLIKLKLISKLKLPTNNKTIYYHLTDKGISLTPIIIEIALWSGENLRGQNINMVKNEEAGLLQSNKEEFINSLITDYKESLNKNIRKS